MSDYVTLFGAAPSGRVYMPPPGEGSAVVAYVPTRPSNEGGAPLKNLVQSQGGLFLEESVHRTKVIIACSVTPGQGSSSPRKGLLLSVRGADRMIPLEAEMPLEIGDHLIVPVDADAEVELSRFHSMVQRFPEETRRLVLSSLRRPSIEWEIDKLKASAEKADKDNEEPGKASGSTGGWKKALVALAYGLLIMVAVAGAAFAGSLYSGRILAQDKPSGTSASAAVCPPPPACTTTAKSEPTPAQRIDAAMKDLLVELTASDKDPDLKALKEQLKQPDWRQDQAMAPALAILFQRAIGAKPGAQDYKAPAQGKVLAGLSKQPVPARELLLRYAVCETKLKDVPPGLPACTPADPQVAAEALEWLVKTLMLQRLASLPVK